MSNSKRWNKSNVVISIAMRRDLHRALTALANRTGRTKGRIVRDALSQLLKRSDRMKKRRAVTVRISRENGPE